ncbi:5-oxopent-3-ene-1,2,5-tricarboxylate decarboxylase [Marinomonas ushuaiensis DSM 15871]|uniref:5-oxopent-3-ene-1,2,5-tricarboxylate decarboxylase n=1 Tax=Marinomonas ushuaiensis DSM 15871 TaxID=1122207 RepID=X7E9F2_9GAMM|nr:fumarylacetoacetate hydrolase family protein [Marinomonas ushuaiensis]ETX11821.1 5-oxopent-3-ene-1,2,5-tricarboxylate decarboxylase [Marinomonas ushuaiensis DSM 15871]
MRILSFVQDGVSKIGLRNQDEVIDLSIALPDLPKDLLEVLQADPALMLKIEAQIKDAPQSARKAYKDIEFSPLIARPSKIICIGRNYAAHAAEGGAATPTYPEIFFRGAESLIGHKQDIIRPTCSDRLDYEGEVAVIIGKKGRHITKENAFDHIAGYTIFNDATIRDYQRKSSQWTIGKTFDGTGAFGPELVTSDELPLGMKEVQIQTRLNGRVMQDANTRDLVFPVDYLIATLSECMTLMPGDVIVTGTPAGVGYARTPPVFMKPGDVCEIEVEGLGILVNTVADE